MIIARGLSHKSIPRVNPLHCAPVHFPHAAAKPLLYFCNMRGKMNTGKKHFWPTRGNGVVGIQEVSKGGPGGLPLAHDFARQSLVCYTFCDR